jgi:hypothetical protein
MLTDPPCQDGTADCFRHEINSSGEKIRCVQKLQLAFKPLSIPAPKKAGVTTEKEG